MTAPSGDSGFSSGDGSFTFTGQSIPHAKVSLQAQAWIEDRAFVGRSDPISVVEDGTTSVGVVTLLPICTGALLSGQVMGVGSNPQAVASGDLDGDGDQDVAVANSTSHDVSVLLNQGDGTFAPHVQHGVGAAPWSVTSGDLDGDGDLDLVVANGNSNTVSVFLNLCE